MSKQEQISAVFERINAARFALRSAALMRDKNAAREHMLTLECERMNLRELRES